MTAFTVGSRVRIPWGLARSVDGEILEVWGDPGHPTHYRVRVFIAQDTDEEPAILLLSPNVLEAA